eukprot:COSAG02_NODE_14955_length_1220_cov_1.317574_1_plen_157_part_10
MEDCRPCRHGAGCRMFACTFRHPPGRARLCRFGAGCRKLHDAAHCQQFLHPKLGGGSGAVGDGGGRQLATRRDEGCALAVRGGGSLTRREVNRDRTVVREKLVKTVPKVNDVAVVLDLSGSMAGSKHAQALSSLRDLFVHTLGPQDRLSIFTFNRAV